LYSAQKFGAQYAWQSPRLNGNSLVRTVNNWFCAKTNRTQKFHMYVTNQFFVISRYEITTHDGQFVSDGGPVPLTERKTCPEVGHWTLKFSPSCYLFTVLNSGLPFSHGRPPKHLLSSGQNTADSAEKLGRLRSCLLASSRLKEC